MLSAILQSEVLQDKDYCLEYNDKQKCVDDRECAFCNTRRDISRPGCIHRTRTEVCSYVILQELFKALPIQKGVEFSLYFPPSPIKF